VVDSEAAWGLWKDGWALMRDDAGVEVFPLWPAREYAEASRTGEWSEYEAEQIDLDDPVLVFGVLVSIAILTRLELL
jgi:hypothetical protein